MKYFSQVILFFIFSSSVFADCSQVELASSQLEWTAFKTPKKVGVKVKFDRYEIKSQPGKTINEILSKSSFNVDSTSVNSGNPERDKKIVKFFFTQNDKVIPIVGNVTKVSDKTVDVLFKINNIEKSISLTKVIKDNELILKGVIDTLDFKLSDSLAAINNACKALHEGKTWSDVEIQITAQFKPSTQCNTEK